MKKIYFLLLLFLPLFSQGQCFDKFSGGLVHSLAIKDDGSLWAWGANFFGALGDSSLPIKVPIPHQITSDYDWKKVSSGKSHSLAIKDNGTLWSWGGGANGRLGNGQNSNVNQPTQVGMDTDWLDLSGGFNHSLAIKSDGTLWSWGENSFGELGVNSQGADVLVPVQVGTQTDWAQIEAAVSFSLGIKQDGTLWSWGLNDKGQLGHGSWFDASIPTQVGNGTNWVEVEAGHTHAIARQQNGTVWVWGYNIKGQLGDGSTYPKSSPIQLGTNSNWTDVTAGDRSSAAVNSSGELYLWGNNNYSQLGNDSVNIFYLPQKLQLSAIFTEVNLGYVHVLAQSDNESLWSWGFNSSGQTGCNYLSTELSVPFEHFCAPLSIKNQKEQLNIRLYPNPVMNTLFLEDHRAFKQALVYDLQGRLISQTENSSQIDVSTLTAGNYIVQFRLDDEQLVRSRFVKE